MNEEIKKMTNDLLEEKKCLIMRNGIRIWIGEEEAKKFFIVLEKLSGSTFVQIGGTVVNTADIIGIFGHEEIQDLALSKGKEGGWKCQYGYGHEKGEYCKCSAQTKKELLSLVAKSCDKGCKNGEIQTEIKDERGIRIKIEKCECAKKFIEEFNSIGRIK